MPAGEGSAAKGQPMSGARKLALEQLPLLEAQSLPTK